MANNIHELDNANIETYPDGSLKDLNIAIFKDDTMNFTSFNNLQIYNKFQINFKIDAFEKQMTVKMRENNIVGKIYRTNSEGTLVEDNLKIDEIASRLKEKLEMEPEIGIRYEYSPNEEHKINSYVTRVIRVGNKTTWYNVEPTGNEILPGPYFSNDSYDLINNIEIKNENTFSKYHPWSSMKKMQIAEDGITTNYDLSEDNGGSYFTEVELYYIKNKFLLEEYDSTTNTYKEIYDLTSVWDNKDVRNAIPQMYRDELVLDPTKYTIGMYEWVSKYPYNDYRPAEFFIKKQGVSSKPTLVNNPEDPTLYYVKLEINGVVYYQKYSNFIESDLYDPTISSSYPFKLYSISKDDTLYEDENVINILERKHYFSCYEASSKVRSSDNKNILISRPGNFPDRYLINVFRQKIKNITGKSDFYIRDMRSYQDFFGVLMDIEFGILNPLSKITGDTGRGTWYPYFIQRETEISNFILPKNKSDEIPYYSYVYGTSNPNNTAKVINKHIFNEFTLETNSGNIVRYTKNGIDFIVNSNGEYCKIIINENNSYYIKYIETISELPISAPHRDEIYCCYCAEDGNIYEPNQNPDNGRLMSIELDSEIEMSSFVKLYVYKCGETDIINSRTSNIYSIENYYYYYPFKWNWIENVGMNTSKFIDGIKIKHNSVSTESNIHNGIYFCNKPEFYNSITDNFTAYNQLTYYTMPAYSGTAERTATLGFDPKTPWIQLTVTSTSNGSDIHTYKAVYEQNSYSGSSSEKGLYENSNKARSFRSFNITHNLSDSGANNIGAFFERSEI